MKKEEKF